jgi:multidrug efflux pump subunit AcrA (membrane-fusion protein)
MAWRRSLLLLGLTLSVTGCTEAVTQGLEVKPVRTLAIDPQPMDDDRRAIGDVRPRYESEHGFRVAGKLIARMIDVGDLVKRSDVIARLDEQDYRNKLKSAVADLAAAEAVLTEARGAEDRSRVLLEHVPAELTRRGFP